MAKSTYFASEFIMGSRTSTKRQMQSGTRILTLLLLVLYVLGTTQIELLHSFVHRHESATVRSSEQDNGSFRSAHFTVDSEQGRDRDAHFSVSDKCDMCDLACHADQALTTTLISPPAIFESAPFDRHTPNPETCLPVISTSRAPPVRL